MDWLGSADCQYLAFRLDLRTSFFWHPPPPPRTWEGVGMVIRESERITCLPGRVGGGWSSDTQERLFVSIDYSVTVLRSNLVVVDFSWIWIGICFCEYVLMNMEASPFFITFHHHQSSSSRNLTICLTLEWSKWIGTPSSFKTPSFLLSLRFWRRSTSIAGR